MALLPSSLCAAETTIVVRLMRARDCRAGWSSHWRFRDALEWQPLRRLVSLTIHAPELEH